MIDMRGFKVVYDNYTYTCLNVEPMWSRDENGKNVVDRMLVYIINHDAQFDILEDEGKAFAFLKDPKFAP